MASQYASKRAMELIKEGRLPGLSLSKSDPGAPVKVVGGPRNNKEKVLTADAAEHLTNTNKRVPNQLHGSVVIGFLHGPDEEPRKEYDPSKEGWEWKNGELVYKG